MVYDANPISKEQLEMAINEQLSDQGLPTDKTRLINMIRTYAPVPEFYVGAGARTIESGTEDVALTPLISTDMAIDGEEQDEWFYDMISALTDAGFEAFYRVDVYFDFSNNSLNVDVTELDSLEAFLWSPALPQLISVPIGWLIYAYAPNYSTDDVEIPLGASIKLSPRPNGLI